MTSIPAIIFAVFLISPPDLMNSYAAPQYTQFAPAFSDDELDQMLGPIALYPDPLLAQILPAASFADQISQAQRLLNGRVDEGLIESQDWDVSVKAIAHYPSILSQMSQNADWTAAVGQAYLMQQPDVGRSIQRLRAEAQQAGVLQSTPQQEVITEANVIRIEPAQPEVIYVPAYDPSLVWGYPEFYGPGLITFGSGLLIGSWLNRDWDWHGRGPYYHGWSGGGWIANSRRFVDTHNRFYVNDQFRNIHVDRNVVNHNISSYRTRMDRDAAARRKPENGVTRQKPEGGPVRGTPQRGVPPAAAPRPGGEVPRSVTPPPGGAPPRPVTPPSGREKPQLAAPSPSAPPRVMTPPQGASPPHAGPPPGGAPRGAPHGGAPAGGGRR
jgi:hypothetical protein